MQRVSVASDGSEGNKESFISAISASGQYVAFESLASNLVAGDTNESSDIFVHDRTTGITWRVSIASDGNQGNGGSANPAISSDGRYVVFQSAASNLVLGDTNDREDVFVYDRTTGETTRVSTSSTGSQGNDHSALPYISADGRFVSFLSEASNLEPGDTNNSRDVFVHDRMTGQTSRVSVAPDGNQWDYTSHYHSISADGRYVMFYSVSNELTPPDFGIFVHDRVTGQVTRVIATVASGVQTVGPDGRYVAFSSEASNLEPGDTNDKIDVFVHDRTTGITERVSVASDGNQASDHSSDPSISADGRFVVFDTRASNLVSGDTNEDSDIFVHDRTAGVTARISIISDGSEGSDKSSHASISSDGRYVSFLSAASNLVPGDTNEVEDVFITNNPLFDGEEEPPEDHVPTLSYSQEEGYVNDGVNPDGGTQHTNLTFKVVYTDSTNTGPEYVRVVFDEKPETIQVNSWPLGVDASALPHLRDGNYANGEQYEDSTFTFSPGTYKYHFETAPDAVSAPVRFPENGLNFEITETKTPVIIIPGILGSELFRNFPGRPSSCGASDLISQIWPPDLAVGLEQMLADLINLKLEPDGFPNVCFPLRVGGIIKDFGGAGYQALIDELKAAGYREDGEDPDLFLFPYDWRLDNRVHVSKLKAKIDAVLQQTGADEVDIVAHSMGGFIAKSYIQTAPNTVRTFVDIATPHLGAPKAFRDLGWGDPELQENMPKGASEFVTLVLGRNMPSAYQLLPSSSYLVSNPQDPYFKYYDYFVYDGADLDQNGVKGKLDFSQSMQLLGSDIANTNDNAPFWTNIHDTIDQWRGSDYGVDKVVDIAGCGTFTIGKIFTQLRRDTSDSESKYGLVTIDGDGTVPLRSAEGWAALNAQETYYVKGIEHGKLPNSANVAQLVVNILEGKNQELPSEIATNTDHCGISGVSVEWHSPIELHVYDAQGNHAGPTIDGIENNIPGALYDVIGHDKFAFLPKDATYTIAGKATGIGSFDAYVKRIENGDITKTNYFNEIPLTSINAEVELNVGPQTVSPIKIDQNHHRVF